MKGDGQQLDNHQTLHQSQTPPACEAVTKATGDRLLPMAPVASAALQGAICCFSKELLCAVLCISNFQLTASGMHTSRVIFLPLGCKGSCKIISLLAYRVGSASTDGWHNGGFPFTGKQFRILDGKK